MSILCGPLIRKGERNIVSSSVDSESDYFFMNVLSLAQFEQSSADVRPFFTRNRSIISIPDSTALLEFQTIQRIFWCTAPILSSLLLMNRNILNPI